MSVPDEDDRGRGEVEGREHRVGREHVLPHRVAGARVEERGRAELGTRAERLEERALARAQGRGRPAGGGGRVGGEVDDVDQPERAEVVVSDQADVRPRLGELAGAARLGAVAHDVAKTPDGVRRLGVDGRQNGFEGVEVGVDVRDDGNAHGWSTLARLALLAVALAGWAIAAVFLLRTQVPELSLPDVDPGAFLSDRGIERAEAYRRTTRWLWVAATLAGFTAVGILAWRARPLARAVGQRARGRVRTGVALGALCVLALWLAQTPVGAVAHWWRRRHGLSGQSYGGWLADETLGLAVSAVVVLVVVAGAMLLAGRLGRRWWLAGGCALAVFGAAFVLVKPLVVEPLFNRFSPLADETLTREIEALGVRLGVEVGSVDVADASRRTTTANAFVTGIGPTRRIALYDTLLDGRFAAGEVAFVTAHELAHVASRHLWKAVAWFGLIAFPSVALVAWVAERRGGLGSPAAVPAALFCVLLLFVALAPVENAISRRYEAEADWLALGATGDPESAIAFQRSLALANLVDPTPPAWSRILLATHPSALERVRMAEAFASASASASR